MIDSLSATLYNLNVHPLEVVSRFCDPQLQVGENYSYLFHLKPHISLVFKRTLHSDKKRFKLLNTDNPLQPEFTIVIFIHYKPRIAVAIFDL